MQHKIEPQFQEIIVEISHNCNLSCIMCGYGRHNNPVDSKKFLSFDDYKKIINKIGNRTKCVRLNGRGESLIHPNFIKIIQYTKKLYPTLSINLFSNLSIDSNTILNTLISNKVQLFISIDSTDKIELSNIRRGASFNTIKRNIKILKNLIPRPFIIFTAQESNIHRIYDIAEFAFNNNCHILFNTIRRDMGIESFINCVKEHLTEIQNNFDKVAQLYSGTNLEYKIPDQMAGIKINTQACSRTSGSSLTCPALYKELCIFYDGTVTPCNMFNPYEYGNIFTESLDEIWDSKKRIEFLQSYKSNNYCKNCANLGV